MLTGTQTVEKNSAMKFTLNQPLGPILKKYATETRRETGNKVIFCGKTLADLWCRFRNMEKYDPKRRSMFSLIEEEHKKNSNEIAKELKRRSYVEFGRQSYDDEVTDFGRGDDRDHRSNRHYQDLPEAER